MRQIAGMVLAGLAFAALVHGVSLAALPHAATRNAYARLADIAPPNRLVVLPDPQPGKAALAFLDPAFVVAVCRYDLSAGPVAISFEHGPTYGSVSFYTSQLIAYAAFNDRAGTRGSVTLDLIEQGRKPRAGQEEDAGKVIRPVVESPSRAGLAVIRLLAGEPSMRADLRKRLERATCTPRTNG
jgi:uncharacterized membrane protein